MNSRFISYTAHECCLLLTVSCRSCFLYRAKAKHSRAEWSCRCRRTRCSLYWTLCSCASNLRNKTTSVIRVLYYRPDQSVRSNPHISPLYNRCWISLLLQSFLPDAYESNCSDSCCCWFSCTLQQNSFLKVGLRAKCKNIVAVVKIFKLTWQIVATKLKQRNFISTSRRTFDVLLLLSDTIIFSLWNKTRLLKLCSHSEPLTITVPIKDSKHDQFAHYIWINPMVTTKISPKSVQLRF